jgi:hypothetical protein
MSRAETQGRRVGNRAAILWSLRLRVTARGGSGVRVIRVIRCPQDPFLSGALFLVILVALCEPFFPGDRETKRGHSTFSEKGTFYFFGAG